MSWAGGGEFGKALLEVLHFGHRFAGGFLPFSSLTRSGAFAVHRDLCYSRYL